MTVSYIRWRDACAEEAAEPNTPVSDSPLVELHEVGFLIGETDHSVSLSLEVEKDGRPSRWRLHIPKTCIIERRDVPLGRAFRLDRRRKDAAVMRHR
jgi:hypothetical protein